MSANLVIGDDFVKPIALTKDGVSFIISASAVVQVAIIKRDRSALISTVTTSDRLATGADWSISTIVVDIPESETINYTTIGKAYVEIQVADPKKQTFFADIDLVKGLIP